MPMYKVWNGTRTIKKVVKADNREALISKGKAKLNIPACSETQLVLQEDGTDVDDDEVLEYFGDQVLILLTSDEKWGDPSAVAAATSSTPTRETVHAPLEPVLTPVPAQPVSQTPETPKSSKSNNLPSVSSDMPIPDRIELPEFSPNIIMMLQNNAGGEGMNGVLKEAALYYQFRYPGMRDSAYYQAIGRKLVTKYPCLAHDGPKKWSYFSSKLSSRIRQMRLKENKKTTLVTRLPSESSDAPVAKRFHIERPVGGRILSQEEFQGRSVELKEEWEGRRSDANMKLLMADIRSYYNSWRLGKSVVEIVEQVPCLQDGRFILEELYFCIGGSDVGKGREQIKGNSDKLFSNIVMAIPDAISSAPKAIMDSSFNLLQALESKIAIVKGKGTKSKSLLTILEVDDIDMTEEVLRRTLSVKEKAPLALRILSTDGDIKMVYIVGEGAIINTHTTNVLDAILILLGAYYIFDLNYPAIYGQLLGFLQQHILEEPYTYFKGSNYQIFSNKLKFLMTEL